jgi:membrane protease subunit HflK
MHAQFEVQYRIPDAKADEYVRQVRDHANLVRSVVKQAAVAEAARTPAEVVLHDCKTLAYKIQKRAQTHLDELGSGIAIDTVIAPKSHYPLQTTAEFLAVDAASNQKTMLINDAQSERQKKLNGAAGEVWREINAEVEKIDQAKTDVERETIIKKIGEIMASRATGDAGGKIKLAQRDREKIVNEMLGERSQFEALLDQYRQNPELVRTRLSQLVREELFSGKGVSKWVLPPNDKQVVLWLAVDPKELAQREKDRLEEMRKKGRY